VQNVCEEIINTAMELYKECDAKEEEVRVKE